MTTVSLPPETHEQIKQVRREMAAENETDYTMSETVSELIETWRDQNE